MHTKMISDKQYMMTQKKNHNIAQAGEAVNAAVKRIAKVAEKFATDYPDIGGETVDSCEKAKVAANSIQRLCESLFASESYATEQIDLLYERRTIILSSKSLMSFITRIILLVDIVIVKQLLGVKRKNAHSSMDFECVIDFTEFVKAFSMFGIEMVALAAVIGTQQKNIEEQYHAQIYSAKKTIEHSIKILQTSSEICFVHGDCAVAKENRDTVFCQIRRAIDLIHFAVKGSFNNPSIQPQSKQPTCLWTTKKGTIYSILKNYIRLIECFETETQMEKTYLNKNDTMSPQDADIYDTDNFRELAYDDENMLTEDAIISRNIKSPMYLRQVRHISKIKKELINTLENLLEKTQDFTDSAYTKHDNREKILLQCKRSQLELKNYLLENINNNRKTSALQLRNEQKNRTIRATRDLFVQITLSLADQVTILNHCLSMSINLINGMKIFATNQELHNFQKSSCKFNDYCDFFVDTCKLLWHIAPTEVLQVQANCLSINLRIYGPQVLLAAKVLLNYPTSVYANENLNAFIEVWNWMMLELTYIVEQIMESPKFGQLSLPDNFEKFELPAKQNQLENSTIATNDSLLKDDSKDPSTFYSNPMESVNHNNDILKRAQNMSSMAFLMYQFTKGCGTLRTTQDLFTQAEHLAEEANRFYKLLRQISYQVPAGQNKKDLLNNLDGVPTFVQTLQFTVKDHTVGKAATFVKVDHVIHETKSLMGIINKVVSKCLDCASKYKLNLTDLSDGEASASLRGDDNCSGGVSDSKGTTSTSEASM